MSKGYVKKSFSVGVLFVFMLVSVFAAPLPVDAATDTTIGWNDVKQEIDGFGVSQAYWSLAIYNLSEPVRSQVMDLLFRQDTGIGASILRGEIFPEYNPSQGVYDFVNPKPDQVWVMQQAKARGVDKITATTWSPPGWMKTNNQTNNGGYLKSECYSDYANLLAMFVKEYKRLHNIDLYSVSMSNEPNAMTFLSWNSCQWDSTGIKNFLGSYLKPTFEREGITGTKVIAAEPSWWREDLMQDALNDATACSRLDIAGAHSYSVPVPFPVTPFDTAAAKGKKVWMTEVSDANGNDPGMGSGLKWAKNIHDFMTKAQANAWLYWLGAYPGNKDEGLIYTDLAANTYTLTKRYYAFGHFSKFIRPGYVRIGMTENPISGVYTSAYKDPATGKFVIVAVNDSPATATAELNLVPNGFTAGSITPYTTSDGLNMQKGHNIPLVNGKFQTYIAPNSIMTFTGQNGSAPDPVEQSLTDELSDWSKTYSHTGGMVLDSANARYFNWDYSRATRSGTDTESITYNLQNITNFTATLFHHKEWYGVDFYASPDNQNWTWIGFVCTPGVYTGGFWYRKVYTPLQLLPDGTNYLKIQFSGAGAWNKQISRVKIDYIP